MSTPQQCIGRIDTPYGSATIVVGRYPAGGAIAIQLSTGLFQDTGKRVPSGHVVSPVWRILDPANVPPAFGRGSTASQAAAAYAVR